MVTSLGYREIGRFFCVGKKIKKHESIAAVVFLARVSKDKPHRLRRR